MNPHHGIVVFSTGRRDRSHLKALIHSIREFAPEMYLVVLTDEPTYYPFIWVDGLPGRTCYAERLNVLDYSPFEITLLLDDDVCLTAPLPDFDELLGENDAAFAVDPLAPTLKDALDGHNKEAWLPPEEAALMQTVGSPESVVHFNSGVCLLRYSAKGLMKRWMNEWSRFGEANQMALVRALQTGLYKVGTLPASMNVPFDRLDGDTRIVHFLRDKDAGLAAHLQNSDTVLTDDPVNDAWRHCLVHGHHQKFHYETVGKLLRETFERSRQSPHVLVFGYGPDSHVWSELSRVLDGTCCFVENEAKWLKKGREEGLDMVPVEYKSQRGVPLKSIVHLKDSGLPTRLLATEFNLYLIDGPRSHGPESHGREEPLCIVRTLLDRNATTPACIIMAGYHRLHERVVSTVHLGRPTFVYTDGNCSTAVWMTGPA